jgi:response regulator NasT
MSARILLIDVEAARTDALARALAAAGLELLGVVSDTADVYAQVEMLNPDAILIGVDSPTRDTLEGLAVIGRHFPRPILMLSDSSDTELVHRAARDGISTYAVDGISPLLLRSLLEVTIAHFQNLKAMQADLNQAQKALSDRRAIDRAKYLIMERLGVGEDEAYHQLRREAMDQGIRIGVLARRLIQAGETIKAKDKNP